MSDQTQNIQTEQTSTFRLSLMKRYLHEQMPGEMQEFVDGGNLKSGYENLDAVTNLYPGLYVVGAISSLGKTTFIHQMADQIAEAGTPVLFFSLEQSTLELASKSLSRIMAKSMARKNIMNDAMTSLQIRKHGSDPRVVEAIAAYDQFAENMYIAECTFRASIETIENTVHEFIKQKGKKPVVIVDYLQVIQPPEGSHMTTKDLVDMHVRRLKQLQSDNKLVLMVISSLNRQNYMSQIDFESFKESGGIEYTADVVWGLQLSVIHHELFNQQTEINKKREMIRKAKAANPRSIEMVCLKNRFGISSYSCMFDYYPQYDYFRPIVDESTEALMRSNLDKDGFIKVPDRFEKPFDH